MFYYIHIHKIYITQCLNKKNNSKHDENQAKSEFSKQFKHS